MRATAIALVLIFCIAAVSATAWGQVLFEENFNYTTSSTLVSNGWVAHSAAGTNAQTVGATSLTYPAYPSSGIGGSVSLVTSGEDVDSALTSPVSTGSVYASLLVKVDSATSAGDYFFHFIANSRTSNVFMARLFARKANNGNLTFGISKSSTAAATPVVYADSIYTIGTTYLIVTKYTFSTGSTTDDDVRLFVFVNPDLPASEPAAPTVGPVTTTQADATTLSYVALRQGSAASSPLVTVDGIRVGLTWNNAPLPIQLSSFTGSAVNGTTVLLRWTTLSEINNYGFYVQRSRGEEQTYADLPNSFVPGKGTTVVPQDYSFTDLTAGAGVWYYRLEAG